VPGGLIVETAGQATLADYVTAFRRRKWLILGIAAITVAAAVVVSSVEAKQFTATATVLVNPSPLITTGAGSTSADAQARYDATQAQLAHTVQVAGPAVLAAHVPGITSNELLSSSSVTADASSNIVTFIVRQGRPEDAVKLVNAFAKQFTIYRTQQDSSALHHELRGITRQVDALTREIHAASAAGGPTDALHVKLNQLLRTQAALQNLVLLEKGGAAVASSAQSAPQTKPRTVRNCAIAVALGLIIGCIVAGLTEALDSRVRSAGQIERGLDLPLLARLSTPPDALRKEGRVALLSDARDTHGEDYAKLRVAFDFANLGVRAKTVLVTSAEEGDGKSTTVANLGVALARTGRRVAVVDLDLRRPSLHELFGVEPHPGVTDVVTHTATLDDALHAVVLSAGAEETPVANGDGPAASVHVMPSGSPPSHASEFLGSLGLRQLIQDLGAAFDVVLIDSPPALPVSDAASIGELVDGILVVVRSSTLDTAALAEFQRMLALSPAPRLGYVLTGAETDDGTYPSHGYGARGYGPVLGALRPSSAKVNRE
jgi:succinoglycan biosynthesis transport protein ExoP